MRSTRATAALDRLNRRSEGRQYRMVLTNSGTFKLRERVAGVDKDLSGELSLDEFVRIADSLGPQKTVRLTKNDIAFARQLVKKS